jgi:hypothetical protein
MNAPHSKKQSATSGNRRSSKGKSKTTGSRSDDAAQMPAMGTAEEDLVGAAQVFEDGAIPAWRPFARFGAWVALAAQIDKTKEFLLFLEKEGRPKKGTAELRSPWTEYIRDTPAQVETLRQRTLPGIEDYFGGPSGMKREMRVLAKRAGESRSGEPIDIANSLLSWGNGMEAWAHARLLGKEEDTDRRAARYLRVKSIKRMVDEALDVQRHPAWYDRVLRRPSRKRLEMALNWQRRPSEREEPIPPVPREDAPSPKDASSKDASSPEAAPAARQEAPAAGQEEAPAAGQERASRRETDPKREAGPKRETTSRPQPGGEQPERSE